MTSNALALMQADEIAMIRQKAEILITSGFLPEAIKTPEQAIAIIFYGRELNVPDWAALKHISVVKGTPQVDGQLAIALVQRSGLLEKFIIEKSDVRECRLTMQRRGQPPFTVHCTFDEAGQLKTSESRDGKNTTISLTEKYNWKQQPKTMLFYFTFKQGARRLFSDVLNGMAGNRDGELSIADAALENAALYDTEFGNADEYDVLPDWWSYITDWAFRTFDYETDAVTAALQYAAGWREDKRVAMAAVIACHCNYDVKCVETYTAENKFKFETFEAAKRVIEAYHAVMQLEDVEEGELVEGEAV